MTSTSASVKVRPGVPDAQIMCSDAKITRAWGPRLSKNKCWTHELVVFGVQWTHKFLATAFDSSSYKGNALINSNDTSKQEFLELIGSYLDSLIDHLQERLCNDSTEVLDA